MTADLRYSVWCRRRFDLAPKLATNSPSTSARRSGVNPKRVSKSKRISPPLRICLPNSSTTSPAATSNCPWQRKILSSVLPCADRLVPEKAEKNRIPRNSGEAPRALRIGLTFNRISSQMSIPRYPLWPTAQRARAMRQRPSIRPSFCESLRSKSLWGMPPGTRQCWCSFQIPRCPFG